MSSRSHWVYIAALSYSVLTVLVGVLTTLGTGSIALGLAAVVASLINVAGGVLIAALIAGDR